MSRIHLAKLLTLDISISDAFSFQPLPEFAIEEDVVCFWEDEQVSFIIATDEQRPHPKHEDHWAELSESLAKEFGQLSVMEEDSYETESGIPVSYKIFMTGSGDDASVMIYHLISNKKVAYWVIPSLLFCTDHEAVNAIVISLMETAKLK